MLSKYLSFTLLLCFSINLLEIKGQRSPYAGSRPNGYKDRLRPEAGGQEGDIVNRFNGNNNERLPYDALGDAALVHQLNRLPEDKRPFWLINQAHIEAQRNTPSAGGVLNSQRPQTAANATANAGNNNGDGLTNRFSDEARPGGAGSIGIGPIGSGAGRPISDNIYDHNAISQQPIVYPSNISEEEKRRMEAVAQEQQRQALNERRNQNPNQNQDQQLPAPVRSFPVPLTERERPLRTRNVPLIRPSSFRTRELQYPGIAPYFVDYDF